MLTYSLFHLITLYLVPTASLSHFLKYGILFPQLSMTVTVLIPSSITSTLTTSCKAFLTF